MSYLKYHICVIIPENTYSFYLFQVGTVQILDQPEYYGKSVWIQRAGPSRRISHFNDNSTHIESNNLLIKKLEKNHENKEKNAERYQGFW